MKKCLCLIMVAVLMLSLVACQASVFEQDKETIAAQETIAQDLEAPREPVVNNEGVYSSQEINKIATELKAKWQAVDRAKSSLEETTDSNGVRRYSETQALRKIEIDHETYGKRDIEFEREYYFDDSEMYFARLKNAGKEMRFYFKGGRLIRWLDASGRYYDRSEDHDEFTLYEALLFSEASNLWAEFDSENILVNSYLQ